MYTYLIKTQVKMIHAFELPIGYNEQSEYTQKALYLDAARTSISQVSQLRSVLRGKIVLVKPRGSKVTYKVAVTEAVEKLALSINTRDEAVELAIHTQLHGPDHVHVVH